MTRCSWSVEVEQAKTTRDKTSPRDQQSASERMRIESKEQMEFLELREQQAARLEQEAKQQVLEVELREIKIIDEQRCAIRDQANCGFNL